MNLIVYCDGSGTTGGPAGIGYAAFLPDMTLYREGSLPLTDATNQKAEILAAAFALHELPAGSTVEVRSDSEYVVKGFTLWVPDWQKRGWKKKTGGRPKNTAHWQRLLSAADRHRSVRFVWCRGHDGIFGNERADELAGAARQVALSG